MNPDRHLNINELLSALDARPEAVVARMPFKERLALLERVVLGREAISEEMGRALLSALHLETREVAAALAKVQRTRRENEEGRLAWEQLQKIEERMKEPVAALTAKAVEVFGPDWEGIRPIPFSIDYESDRVWLSNAPVLEPLADAVTEAMQDRAPLARIARRFEEEPDVRDLLALCERRRESAEDAARRAS